MTKAELRERLITAFEAQGFKINPHLRPARQNKAAYRRMQQKARLEQIGIHWRFLVENLELAKRFIRNGKEIDPSKIELEFIEVKSESKDERLFRWWNLIWWSIPYQRSYGRQMRFILWDNFHDAPFGLICLQSPVLKMSVRDEYLGIPNNELDVWVNRSMSAQRVGALPPYNEILGGKLVALSLTCNEIRDAYRRKYSKAVSLIKGRRLSPEILFITTTSAFGRSSLYNRLKYKDEPVALSLGYTQGSGSFHVPEYLYLELVKLLEKAGNPMARSFGNGSSRKLKIISQGLKLLNLPSYEFHGLRRQFFLFPFVRNLQEVIQENLSPEWIDRPFPSVQDFWKERWALKRADSDPSWKKFSKNRFLTRHVNPLLEG